MENLLKIEKVQTYPIFETSLKKYSFTNIYCSNVKSHPCEYDLHILSNMSR